MCGQPTACEREWDRGCSYPCGPSREEGGRGRDFVYGEVRMRIGHQVLVLTRLSSDYGLKNALTRRTIDCLFGN